MLCLWNSTVVDLRFQTWREISDLFITNMYNFTPQDFSLYLSVSFLPSFLSLSSLFFSVFCLVVLTFFFFSPVLSFYHLYFFFLIRSRFLSFPHPLPPFSPLFLLSHLFISFFIYFSLCLFLFIFLLILFILFYFISLFSSFPFSYILFLFFVLFNFHLFPFLLLCVSFYLLLSFLSFLFSFTFFFFLSFLFSFTLLFILIHLIVFFLSPSFHFLTTWAIWMHEI